MTEAGQARGAERMTVRRVPFEFARSGAGQWHRERPEFSHIVNAASLAMPYLEPYLIASMRKARPLIDSPSLQKELDHYVAQEATHYRQHRRFNDTLSEAGYACVAHIEEALARDYKRLGDEKSLRFNLAYAEGFESMALVIGHMLINDREYLFANSDSAVASLVLWHFVEEIEHKNVAFDVFHHLYGSYVWRMIGLVYATGHIFWRTGQGYRALLREDGLWRNLKSRWRLARLLGRIFRNILPGWFRIWRPSYHPSQIPDPSWGLAWAALYAEDSGQAAALDTGNLSSDLPRAAA